MDDGLPTLAVKFVGYMERRVSMFVGGGGGGTVGFFFATAENTIDPIVRVRYDRRDTRVKKGQSNV